MSHRDINASPTRLWALAECCYILDELPTLKDRQAVIDALSTMSTLSKPALRSSSEAREEGREKS